MRTCSMAFAKNDSPHANSRSLMPFTRIVGLSLQIFLRKLSKL